MKALFIVCIILLIFVLLLSSCYMDYNSNISTDIQSSETQISIEQSDISEQNSKTDVSTDESKQVEYIDILFKERTFIKCCDASNEPNYESVYKFDINGTLTYSINILEGFCQSFAKYFVRMYENSYEIWFYKNGEKESAKILFTVDTDNHIKDEYNCPTSFINETEFDTIYNFHTEWNKVPLNSFDE